MGKLNSSKGKGWMERGFVQQLVGQWLCKREGKRKCSWRGPVHWNVEKIPYEITRVTETLWEHSNIDIAFFRSLSLFLFLILIFFFFYFIYYLVPAKEQNDNFRVLFYKVCAVIYHGHQASLTSDRKPQCPKSETRQSNFHV